MYLLYDSEIKALGKQAETFVKHQRLLMPLLQAVVKHEGLIVEETPAAIAKHLLKERGVLGSHYLQGDLDRLTKEIQVNLSNMEWFNNNC